MLKKLLMVSIFALIISSVGHFYLYMRLAVPFAPPVSTFLIPVFIFLWSLTFFGFPILRVLPSRLRIFLEIPMFTWMGIAYIFILICFLTSPISLILKWVGWSEIPLAASVWILGLIISAHAVFRANSEEDVFTTEIEVIKNISDKINNVKIVVLSDIHVSGVIRAGRMKRLVAKVNQMRPDLIVITGDLVDGTVGQLRKEVAPLKALAAAHGVVYITGNHEYYSGANRWKEYLANEFSWRVLSNSHWMTDIHDVPFLILGLEDRSWLNQKGIPKSSDPRLKLATEGLTAQDYENHFTLLLTHQPKDFYHTLSNPGIDLQVSGHTHSGQFWPLYLLVKNDQTYNAGLYPLSEKQNIYVNQGTGFWGPPMRLATRCEISVLIFKKKETS